MGRTSAHHTAPNSSKKEENNDDDDGQDSTTTQSVLPWLQYAPLALCASSAAIAMLWTWPQRHEGWTPYLLCRISFFTLVCLIMSPELRLRLAAFPRRARRALSKRFSHSSSSKKHAAGAASAADWGRGLPVRALANYSWD